MPEETIYVEVPEATLQELMDSVERLGQLADQMRQTHAAQVAAFNNLLAVLAKDSAH